jgi:hypothetical protein
MCLEGARRKGQMWNGPNKNNKEPPLSTIGKVRLTAIQGRHTWHDPLADVGVERCSIIKGCCVYWGEEEERVRCEMDQLKTTKEPQLSTIGKERLTSIYVCHTWHVPLAEVGVERCSFIKGCCVWEEEEERVRCEMDQITQQRTTTINQLQEDLPFSNRVTLDTSHWLMSWLNAAAFLKAVVFGRRKKKGWDVKWTK